MARLGVVAPGAGGVACGRLISGWFPPDTARSETVRTLALGEIQDEGREPEYGGHQQHPLEIGIE